MIRPSDTRPLQILDAPQMRAADAWTITHLGIPGAVLMENAGRAVVAALETRVEGLASGRVVVLCGTGNNGGDGFVIARTLHERGVEATVVVVGAASSLGGDARLHYDIVNRLGLPVVHVPDNDAWTEQGPRVATADVVVDALLGTGTSRPLTGLLAAVVTDVNVSAAVVVSVDIPSGLSASSHRLIGPAVRADLTVALGALKVPLVLPPAADHAGTVVVADIGIPHQAVEGVAGQRRYLLTRESVRALVPARRADSHKGQYGRVVVVGGALGMTGAAVLAARGALRAGAGLVTVATPASAQPIAAGLGVEFITMALPEAEGTCGPGAAAVVAALGADVVAVGPGLGTGPAATAFVLDLVARRASPLVLDADALTACAGHMDMLRGPHQHPVVVTPHPGEMARLLGCSTKDVQADRLSAAVQLATSHQLYVVLKGHRSIIALPDGRAYVNPTGTPGMATGGAGDVLTGMTAAWAAQLPDTGAACQLAVYLHGAAGECASVAEGEVSMTAADIAAHIGTALTALLRPDAPMRAAE